MGISPVDVKKLREKTGAGFGDCKKALEQASGDLKQAETILKEMGLAAVAKRSARSAGEGRIFISINDTQASIVEIACETDFVARNNEFITTAQHITDTIARDNITHENEYITTCISELAAKMKENLSIRTIKQYIISEGDVIASYLHGDTHSIGVIVQLHCADSAIAQREQKKIIALGRDLAMHAAAFCPEFISEDTISNTYRQEQHAILHGQMNNDASMHNKPENIRANILEGKLKKHLNSVCFTEQAFAKDDSKTVAMILTEQGKELGTTITIKDFIVLSKGAENE